MSHRAGLDAEHSLNHNVQVVLLVAKFVFMVLYFVVWGLDSFVFRFSTVFAGVIPVFGRLSLAVLSLAVGVYLVAKSPRTVLGGTPVDRADEPKLITSGAYAWVRHPMYLGSLLVLLAFFLATVSVLSILVWIASFIFLDRVATYEERGLIAIFGGKYVEYQKQVPKWLMRVNRDRREREKNNREKG